MKKELYKQALKEERKELADLLERQAELEILIARKRKDIASLAQLANDNDSVNFILKDVGLTDACREVLKAATEPLTPSEVAVQLELMGYDTSGYKNLLASLYTTLKRMTISLEAEETEKDGKKAFGFISEFERIVKQAQAINILESFKGKEKK